MTKTKRQLRAEAVERLRNIPNERMNAASVVIAIAGEAAYRLGGTRDARDMCIDLLTDDDSTVESLSDEADSREKLEADVLKYYTHTVSTAMWPHSANKHTDMVSVSMDTVLEWLDRQAAITEHEWEIEQAYINGGYKEQIAELTEELDNARAKNRLLKAHIGKMQNGRNGWHIRAVRLQEKVDEQTAERDIYREKLSRALDLAHEIERLMP